MAHLAARPRRPDRAGALPGRLARVHPARPALAAARLQPPGASTGWSGTPSRAAGRASTSPTGSAASPSWPTKHGVPGAQLGILRYDADGADELVVATHGLLNIDSKQPVTADSIFQIGSITKVWTATVVMQLVDEGLAELDAPVVEVLPELRLADPDVTKQVTLRHLLTHTSGIDGDVFTDTGRGDDCIERYVELLGEQTQNHPLGATWSYCNAGFSVLGRVIEKLTGKTWDEALRERLFTPLQMEHAITLPEEALLHAAAVGHVTQDGVKSVAPVWQLPRSIGPAGLVTANAADVLAFARLHLTGGVGPDGTRLLSEESATAMADHQADLPDKYSLGDSWGLGWIRFGWDGRRVYGHDGNTIGQAAFLRVLPELCNRWGLAVTMLTNNDGSRDLYEELYREIFAELAGVEMPRPLTPPQPPLEDPAGAIAPYVGRYERAGVNMDVFAGEDGPTAAHRGHRAARRDGPRPGRRVPAGALRPGAVPDQAAGGRDLVPGHVLRAADRRALPALRRAGHAEGGLVTVTSPSCSPTCATLVECESPSSDLAAVARSADVVARVGTARLGVAPERIVLDGRTHLRWRLGSGPSRVLLLGHHDTVWPLGSLATHPFTVEDGVLRGPGCFDMKAGLVMAFHAAAGLDGVTLLVTGDEELGSPSSRGLIEDEARAGRGGAGARGVRRRRRAQDRAQGRLALRRAGGRPRRPRRPRARARRQRHPRAGPPGAARSARSADPALGTTVTPTAPARARRPTPCRPRARSRSTCACARWPSRTGSTRRCARCAPVLPGAVVEVHRRAQPAAAGGGVVRRAVRARSRRSPYARAAEPDRRGGRRGLRRQLHRRGRHADARRARRGRRRRARRRRARPGRRAARPDRAAARPVEELLDGDRDERTLATTGAARP